MLMPRIESVVQETNGKIDLAKVSERPWKKSSNSNGMSFHLLSYLDTQRMLLFYCHLVDADS